MGAKPVIQLPPFEITRRDVHSYVPKTIVGPVYAHIYSHIVFWYRSGDNFELPVFNKEGIPPGIMYELKIRNNSYRCKVKFLSQPDDNTVLLKLKITRKSS